MLSVLNQNCEDGSVDHGNVDVDVDAGAVKTKSKRARRTRRNTIESNIPLDITQDDAQVLSPQEAAS